MEFGLRGFGWLDLSCAVEKSDIVEHYKIANMPMLLRMVAEEAEGSNVTGQTPGAGLRHSAAMSNRGLHIFTIDMSGVFR